MSKVTKGNVSRREFLTGIGIGGAGLLAMGHMNFAEAALLPQPKRKEKCDTVIIGTGLSGIVAAVAAQEKGARVCVLEKLPEAELGGNSKLAGGFIAIPRDKTREAETEYFEDFMQKSKGKGNAALTKVLAAQSFDGVEWLASKGVELTTPMTVGGYRVKSVIFKPGAYQGMPKGLAVLKGIILKNGGKFYFETKAKQLIMDDHGRVVGLRAQDKEGLKDYLCNAVIIATGGYAGNKEMLEMFVDPDADEMMVRGVKTATGDGHQIAREAGAMWVNMGGMAAVHVAAVSPKNPAAGNPVTAISYLVGINAEGKRYIDESLGYVANGKATMNQPGQKVAMIFDENTKRNPGVTAAVKQFERLGLEVVQAGSIAELASKIQVPASQLEKTIAEFNAAVKDGAALSAQPPKKAFAFKIETPPYYAFYPLVPGITITFGGIKINEHAQVMEADGRIIPGLFAAGECAGGLYYDDYIGGASLANCLVMGRIAGYQAASMK